MITVAGNSFPALWPATLSALKKLTPSAVERFSHVLTKGLKRSARHGNRYYYTNVMWKSLHTVFGDHLEIKSVDFLSTFLAFTFFD